MTDTARNSADAGTRLRRLISGYQVSQAIYAAAELGLADVLRDGPADCRELATRLRVDQDALGRLMRSLAENGIFQVTSHGAYENSQLSELLISDVQHSLHARAMLVGQDYVWRPWGRLVDAVRTGESVFAEVFDEGFFEYLDRHPAGRAVFQSALAGGSVHRAEIIEFIDLARATQCVDVGGGNGYLLAAALARHDRLRGVLFDRPGVLAQADLCLTDQGIRNRCELVEGDFFRSVYAGGDVYLLSQVLHDWDDERATQILRNCRAAMTEVGRLVIIERITVTDGAPPRAGRLSDLNMLLLLGGRERTLGQYEMLLRSAGLAPLAVHQMTDGWGVIEAGPTGRR